MLREQRREQRRERRCGRWRALWRLRKAEGSRATSPETHPASGPRTATTKESGFPADSPRTAARVALHSACVRASARGAPPPRRRAGARVERGSSARGATDRTREEARRRRRRARSARTPLFDCGSEEPPETHARRARRARVTRRYYTCFVVKLHYVGWETARLYGKIFDRTIIMITQKKGHEHWERARLQKNRGGNQIFLGDDT